ncbi:MAG: putative DNA-binding domain-containing protein [Sedimenticolaceae bacterium]|nr:putative DNA-binding domain-containing protein [Sedimenticolaceae bacterium]
MTSSVPEPGFKRLQKAFAAHIRNPREVPAPEGIEDRRMAIYRDLFYNNIESFLSGNFPVLREITPDEKWHGIVRDFMVKHRCETPHFPEIAQEFLAYLSESREAEADDYPFMLELAHYEWVELALGISDEDAELPPHDPNGNLLDGSPLVSPVAWNLSYSYPVHRISPEMIPETPSAEPNHLVVYRDRLDKIHFLEINAVTQRLLELIKQNALATGLEILQMIADEMQHPDPDVVITAGTQLMQDLKARNIIIGTRQ